jgi:O-antigen ligase
MGANGALNTVAAEEQSVGERTRLTQSAAHIFAAHPLTGIGLGASPIAIRDQFPGFDTAYQPPHLTILDAALETGLLGGASYLLLLVLPWLVLFRHPSQLARPELAGAFALLLSITIVGFFDYYTWLLVPGRLWQWLSWGLLAAAARRPD